jgi:DNA-binding SARP family transcriptional activator/LysM repeat protein
VTLAWLIWAWLVASLVVEFGLALADRVAPRSTWVQTLRAISGRLTAPIARRAVTAAFVVQVVGRSVVPIAAAAPIEDQAVAVSAPAPDAPLVASTDAETPASSPSTYLVAPGDSLWSIAERVYGDGMAYPRIVDANVGRRMVDGKVFTRQGVVLPGWQLLVPDAPEPADPPPADGWYTVEPGDTLQGIAARTLGDPEQWSTIFDLNRGTARLSDGHTLMSPNLIWPGLRLRLPDGQTDSTSDVDATAQPGDHDDAAESVAADVEDPAPADADQPDARMPIPESHGAATAPWERLAFAEQPAASAPATAATEPSAVRQVEPTPAPTAGAQADGSSVVDIASSTNGTADGLPALGQVTETATDSDTTADDASPGADAPQAESAGAVDTSPLAPVDLDRAVAATLGGLGLAALGAGGAVWATRRWRRHSRLTAERESDVVVQDGYATAELDDELTHRLRGAERDPVLAVTAHVVRYLHEHELDQVRIVAARSGRSSTILTLEASLSVQGRLFDALDELGPRIGIGAEAVLSADHDILLKLTGLRKLRLLGSGPSASESVPWLTELGVLYSRQILFVDWRALHHALVAGLQGQGADTILTSLLATLTARQRPSDLRLWMITPPRLLPAPLTRLPHLVRPPVAPDDAEGVIATIDEVRAELEARLAGPPDEVRRAPELALVVGELADLDQHADALHLIGTQGPACGVRLLAATSAPEGLHSPLLPHFTTRLVLQTRDEEASMAVLGSSDAAFLGGGGRLLLRLDAREPVELYGYRVALEHLERLLRVMREAYPPELDAVRTRSIDIDRAESSDEIAADRSPRSIERHESAVSRGPTPGERTAPAPECEQTSARTDALPSVELVPKRDQPHVPLDEQASQPRLATAAPDIPLPLSGREEPDPIDPAAPPDAQDEPLCTTPGGTDAVNQPRSTPEGWVPSDSNPSPALPMDTLLPLRTGSHPDGLATSTGLPSVNGTLRHGGETVAEPIGEAPVSTAAVAPTPTPLYVQCFGGPQVLYHGEHVWPASTVGDSKPWELLLFLASQPAEGVAREVVTEAFWPNDDRDVEVGHRLRQLRYRLRTALERFAPGLPREVVLHDGGVFRLDPELVASDVQSFLALQRQARTSCREDAIVAFEQARALYHGDLFDAAAARRYAWAEDRDDSGVTLQEHLHKVHHQLTWNLADVYRLSGQLDLALALYRELVQRDPADESLWVALFRTHFERRDLDGLLAEERWLRQALRSVATEDEDEDPDLDLSLIEPGPETLAEFERLVADLTARQRATAGREATRTPPERARPTRRSG